MANFETKFGVRGNSPSWFTRCVYGFGRCLNTVGVNHMQSFSPNGLLSQPRWATEGSTCWGNSLGMIVGDEAAQNLLCFKFIFCSGSDGGVEARICAAIGGCEFFPAVSWLKVCRRQRVILFSDVQLLRVVFFGAPSRGLGRTCSVLFVSVLFSRNGRGDREYPNDLCPILYDCVLSRLLMLTARAAMNYSPRCRSVC